MIGLDDPRWEGLSGGYRTAFDPRPLLIRLESSNDKEMVWRQLWTELHRQGDVGEASFAAVPQLVRIYSQRLTLDWNAYAIVAVIELARGTGRNPDVPAWLKDDYFQGIQNLAVVACAEIQSAKDAEAVRSMISIIALAKGSRNHTRFLLEYSDDELLEIEKRVGEGPE